METLRSGTDELRFADPDVIRAWIGDRECRAPGDTTRSEAKASSHFVKDGDCISFDSFTRRPQGLIREIIRQRPERSVLRRVHC